MYHAAIVNIYPFNSFKIPQSFPKVIQDCDERILIAGIGELPEYIAYWAPLP
jgi:hypothetical protein